MAQHRSPPTSCEPSAPMTDGPSSLAGLSAFSNRDQRGWTLVTDANGRESSGRIDHAARAARQARDDGHDAGNGNPSRSGIHQVNSV
jgi:hypothetical protein